MAKEYDKIDKDSLCERYEKYIDTGSDSKTPRLKFEPEAVQMFDDWGGFLEYFNTEYLGYKGESGEFDENSKLVEIVNSKTPEEIRDGNMKLNLIPIIEKLKKEGYFSRLGYDVGNPKKMKENELWNIYGRARGNILKGKDFNL